MKPRQPDIRRYPTKRGVRILQHGTVLSEVLSAPGPTHSVADVLAAAILSLAPGPDVLLLGFAGGGLLGPLRAMGGRHCVTALDMDDHGFETFETLCRKWAGEVRLRRAEAGAWLRQSKGRYDLIMVDLSIGHRGDVHIPRLVWMDLPALVRQHLRPRGLAVFNLLPPLEMSWKEGLGRVTRPFGESRVITFDDFENRIVLAGELKATTRAIARRVRATLRRIDSKQAGRIRVRRNRPAAVKV